MTTVSCNNKTEAEFSTKDLKIISQADEMAYKGTDYEKKGNIKKAMEYYKQSIRAYDELINKKNRPQKQLSQLRLNRALIYFLADKENEAKIEIENLKESEPNNILYNELLHSSKIFVLRDYF